MSNVVEKEWTTEAGYKARCLFVGDSHRCGYVEIPKEHRFYNQSYIGEPEDKIYVHGGVTYSGGLNLKDESHWFGFDCAHYQDKTRYSDGIERTLEFVVEECEKLAKQLKELENENS